MFSERLNRPYMLYRLERLKEPAQGAFGTRIKATFGEETVEAWPHLLSRQDQGLTLSLAAFRQSQFYFRPFGVQDTEVHGIPHSTAPRYQMLAEHTLFLGT
jgi:hypothetical protein